MADFFVLATPDKNFIWTTSANLHGHSIIPEAELQASVSATIICLIPWILSLCGVSLYAIFVYFQLSVSLLVCSTIVSMQHLRFNSEGKKRTSSFARFGVSFFTFVKRTASLFPSQKMMFYWLISSTTDSFLHLPQPILMDWCCLWIYLLLIGDAFLMSQHVAGVGFSHTNVAKVVTDSLIT